MVEEGELFRTHAPVKSRTRPVRSVIRPMQGKVIYLLRLSLAAVFFWFGILKVTGVSPVIGLLENTYPLLAASPYIELLGLAEIAIAAGLVIDRLSKHAATLMMLHLLCTLAIAVFSPALVFAPAFPVLTIEGEFIAKNVVLIMAGMVILASRQK